MASRDRSSAWPLAGVWAALIAYASWHPFAGWRWPVEPGLSTLLNLLWLPPPHHSSRFDIWSNFIGYVPMGGLVCLGLLRDQATHPQERLAPWRAVLFGALIASALSLTMEYGQHFLPRRVPSRTDWTLNSAGGLAGGALALAAARCGLLRAWQVLRDQWFVPHGLALLLSWPVALLFPPPVPLGLGQIGVQLTELIAEAVEGTPWVDRVNLWLPAFDDAAQLSPGAEMVAIALGALAPCFVADCMARQLRHRLVLLLGSLALGCSASALSTVLNFGPDHSWAWVTAPVLPGLILTTILGFGMAWLPHRLVAALGLIGLTSLIALVNQAGTDPYAALSLQAWEQGRFVRFHGLSQWLGWLWPFGALLFLLRRLTARTQQHRSR
jgi:VanZ family protein